ncbi:calcium-binding protein [Roseivivax sp. CAU 1761]
MTETIEVRYKELAVGIYHKYIVYTDSNGDEWYARGGPSVGYAATTTGQAENSILRPMGKIITDYGQNDAQYNPDFDEEDDDPSEVIKSGADLSADFQAIMDAMDDMENENHTYNPAGYAGRNSNSVVDTALSRAGLSKPTLDDRGEYLSPASGYILPQTTQSTPTGVRVNSDFVGDVESQFSGAKANSSPLVLDLSGNGAIDLISLSNSVAYWDNNQNGFRSLSGWVDSLDGLLAIDLNEDGVINDNGELFGTETTDGFTILNAYDSNGDLKIDAQDSVWDGLIVWQDVNEDGFSDSAELHGVADFDIVSFDLDATEVSQTNQGHVVTHTSTFTIDDGINPQETRAIHDVWFSYDTINTVYNQEFTYIEAAFYLPIVRGYGTMPDLSISISLDDTGTNNLLDQVVSLYATSFSDLFDATTNVYEDVRDIMFRWAGVDGVSSGARGPYVDGRELGFLEKMMGQDFLQRGIHSNPLSYAGLDLQEGFEIAHNNIYARLLAQSAGGELFTGDFYYDIAGDDFSGITGLDSTKLASLETEATALSTTAEKEVFWGNVVRMIEFSVGTTNLPGADQTALDDAITDSDASLDLAGILTSLEFDDNAGSLFNGDSSDNTINGGAANDDIDGNDGNDTLNGLGGEDDINGGAGDDILTGGTGGDYLRGWQGNGEYHYDLRDGIDTIRETSVGTGNDGDEIVFGSGIDSGDLTFTRAGGSDLVIDIDTGAQTGKIVIEDQFNYAAGGGHVEQITFDDLSTYDLDGQNWTSYGTSGADTLYGVRDGSGGLPDDTIYGGAGNDTIYGGAPNESGYGNDTLYGEAGDDEIYGGLGTDVIYGGADDDEIYGGYGDDELHAGSGNDYMHGGPNGVDSYYYTSGHLTLSGDTSDTIYLDAAWDTVTPDYFKIDSDLQIVFDLDNTITVDGMFSTTPIHDMIYDDTTSVDLSGVTYFTQGTSGNDTLSGSTGSDVLYGFGGNDEIHGGGSYGYGNDTMYGGTGDDELNGGYDNDYLDGGAGDDDITGGAGNDTIFYVSGHDLVYDYTGTDVLEIDESWDYGDLTIGRHVSDLYDLRIDFGTGSVNSVTITDMFYYGRQVDTLRMNDGTGDINLLAFDYTTYGDAGANTLSGVTSGYINSGDTNDMIYGYGGNDDIDAYDGNDTLYGGDGDDNLNGGAGSDYLEGNAGDDYLWGEGGDDLYLYESGDDYIQDRYAGTDIVELDSSWAYGDITIGRYTTDLSDYVISCAGTATDSITLENMFYSNYQVETLRLNDGTGDINLMTMPITSHGTAGANTINGVSNSYFEGGDPVDIIYGYGGADTLSGLDGNDIIYGGEGNDAIYGGYDDDLLYGGAGDDSAAGNDGSDTIVYESGIDTYYNSYGHDDVDTVWIKNGVVIDDIVSIADYGSYETKITLNASVDEIILDSHRYSYSYWFNVLKFDDGFETDQLPDYASWMWGTTGNDVSAGNANDNVIIGDDGNDDIDAGAGADDVHGGSGTDDIHGDGGDDFLHGGAGDDTLYGDGGLDTLWGGDGSDTFTFDSTNAYTETDVIADFDSANDAIDISDLLTAYDPMTDALSDFVEITDNGTDSTLSVDADGGADSFAAVASILGVTGLTDEAALETSGALITS